MKTKQTFILIIAVVIIIVGYLVLVKKAPLETERPDTVFPESVNVDAITYLKIAIGDRAIELALDEGSWNMVQPLQVVASDSEVRAILSDIEMLEPERIITKSDDPELTPKKYGFDKFVGKVSFRQHNEEYSFLIGAGRPGGGYYVMRPDRDDIVFIVPQRFYENLDRMPDELRDRRPFEFDPFEVIRFAIASEKEVEAFVFSREDEISPWEVASPIQGRAASERIEEALLIVGDISIETFVSDKPGEDAQFGLEKPALAVTVWEGDKERTLFLSNKGSRRGMVFAKVGGTDSVFEVSSSLLLDLDKPLNHFRDKNLFDFKAEDVVVLKIDVLDKPQTVIRLVDGLWRITSPVDAETDEPSVRRLLRSLENEEIFTWLKEDSKELEFFGLDTPSIIITAVLDDGKEYSLHYGNRVSKGSQQFYVRRADESPILSVFEALYLMTGKGYLDFLTRRVFSFELSKALRMTVNDLQKPSVVCERIDEDQWQIVEPFELKADTAGVNDILDPLSNLRCAAYLTDDLGDLESYRLDPPQRSISVDVRTEEPEGGEVTHTHTLRLGSLFNEYYRHAKVDGRDYVFLADARLYKEAGDDFVSLFVFRTDPSKVVRFSLVYPDQIVTCNRAKSGWQISEPEVVDADQDEVDVLLDTMQSIKAARYAVHVADDKMLQKFGLDKPVLRVILERNDGLTSELLVGKGESADLVYAKNRDSDSVFLLPTALADRLKKKTADLKKIPRIAPVK